MKHYNLSGLPINPPCVSSRKQTLTAVFASDILYCERGPLLQLRAALPAAADGNVLPFVLKRSQRLWLGDPRLLDCQTLCRETESGFSA